GASSSTARTSRPVRAVWSSSTRSTDASSASTPRSTRKTGRSTPVSVPRSDLGEGGVVRNFLNDFKKFIMRGNVVDLAVAVIVGAAFNTVVQSFAKDVVMGLIGAIFGQPNFNQVAIHVASGRVAVGVFITSVVNFVIVAF